MQERTRNRALIVAALTCPCHIALLPLLAAGTALGAVLESHLGWVFAGATLIFLGALTIAFWKPQEPAGASARTVGVTPTSGPGAVRWIHRPRNERNHGELLLRGN